MRTYLPMRPFRLDKFPRAPNNSPNTRCDAQLASGGNCPGWENVPGNVRGGNFRSVRMSGGLPGIFRANICPTALNVRVSVMSSGVISRAGITRTGNFPRKFSQRGISGENVGGHKLSSIFHGVISGGYCGRFSAGIVGVISNWGGAVSGEFSG